MKNGKTFIVSAVIAVLGAGLTLDWQLVLDERLAGVIVVAIGGVIATVKALYSAEHGADAGEGE